MSDMKPNKQSETWCPLPWVHSHCSAIGTFKPCCNAEGRDSNVSTRNSDYDLTSWFHSESMQQLRSDLNNGIKNSMCGRCWRTEERAGTSIRTSMQNKFDSMVEDEPRIQYLDLKLTNQCNLRCRMCSPSDSNLIGEERDSLLAAGLTPPSNYSGNCNSGSTLASIKPELQQDVYAILEAGVKVLKFTGGEPLVQQPVLDVLHYIVDKGYAKDIRLQLTTNATKFSTRFMDLFAEFNKVHLNISVDGYGSTYEYIRYPYKWSNFNDRIELLKQATHNSTSISYDFTCVPQLFNIENLAQLQQHVGKDRLYMNNILHPEDNYNSLVMVPLDVLKQAGENIQYCSSSNILINSINSLIENYSPPTVQQLKTMVNSIQVLDMNRKQHYKDYLEPRTRDFITESIRKVS